MQSKFIFCSRHGKVSGPSCRACQTEQYIEDVESGKIKREHLVERPDQEDSYLLPLQIKFRAFLVRQSWTENRKPYSWRLGKRDIRVISTEHLKGL